MHRITRMTKPGDQQVTLFGTCGPRTWVKHHLTGSKRMFFGRFWVGIIWGLKKKQSKAGILGRGLVLLYQIG